MKSKRYFAAANTGEGFYDCFDNINDPDREGFLYILKGGPGTGKSTLMKKIGRHFEDLGEDVEYFHCSSDESSLDGVRLPRLNTAVADGTAPHTIDPVMPGISGAIINLSDFIGAGIKEHGAAIKKLALRKKECFDVAYAYIRSAALLDAANRTVLALATDAGAVKNAVKEIRSRLGIKERGVERGRGRRLFLSAVGGEGKINYCAANGYGKVISLAGNEYAAGEILLRLAADMAAEGRGYTSFGDVLSPGRHEALQPDSADTLITVSAPEKGVAVKLEDTVIRDKYNRYKDALMYGRENIDKLLGLAAKALSEAKAAHGEIEAHYVKATDFTAIGRMSEWLIKSLEKGFF